MEERFVKINEEYYEINRTTIPYLKSLFIQNKLKAAPLFDENKKWFGYDFIFHKKTQIFYIAESKIWHT